MNHPMNAVKPQAPFSASHYKGKPCVYDTTARVVYTGFRTMQEARERAAELNQEEPPHARTP